jgi:ferredoxin
MRYLHWPIPTAPRAFTDRAFQTHERREARFDAFAYDQHLRKTKEEIGHRVCGMCLKVCPHEAARSQTEPDARGG